MSEPRGSDQTQLLLSGGLYNFTAFLEMRMGSDANGANLRTSCLLLGTASRLAEYRLIVIN